MSTKVALVLSGCGVNDGSEIHEAVSCLVHLSRHGAQVSCFAPDIDQADVINHAKGEPAGEKRNVLVESARISRGNIAPLSSLDIDGFDLVVFPGGFGAAKNLCDFAQKGADCTVNPDVERVLKGFHSAGKPIALCCIAPVLAAKVLGTKAGGPGCHVTIGSDEGVAGAIGQMGSENVSKPVTEAYTDQKNRIVTAPAYMYDAKPHEVYEGIGKMIDGALALAKAR